MKKGYKRLLIFLSILMIILSFNAFFLNILTKYVMIFFLLVLLVIFDFYLVLERDNKRHFKDILFEIMVFLVTFFIIFYLLGLVVGLAKVPNYITFKGIKDVLLPIILFCILREILRYNLLCKSDGNVLCTIFVVILMLFFDIYDDYYYASFISQYTILRFVALILLPAIGRNISYSYVSKNYGYRPVIVFDLIFSLSFYLLPLIPNPSEYIMSVIYLLVPILFAYRIARFSERRKDEVLPSNYKKRHIKGMIVPVILIMAMVYLYSGYFRFYAIAIASGSMESVIHKGDIVIVDQKYNFNDLDVGDVIAFKHEKIIVVHRIVKRVELGGNHLYFYTKGDANNNVDDVIIEDNIFIGKVKYKIPYIGYPTVWFNED